MPSEQHQAIVTALRQNAAPDAGGPLDVAVARAGFEAMSGMTPLPEGVAFEKSQASGVPAEWAIPTGADDSKVLLYLHGGGYVLGSINTHRGLAARIAADSGTRALILDYRLAPETPFPGAVDDATAGYASLLEAGIQPERIVIGGDSAGGGLTFATLVNLRERGMPLPGAAFALSPWVDLEGLGDTMRTKADVDPMCQKDGLAELARLYLGGANPRTPLAAPLYADLKGLPPMLIQVGTAETLLDDANRIVERLRSADVPVEIQRYEGLVHVFQGFAPIVPESVDAIEKIGAFVKSHL